MTAKEKQVSEFGEKIAEMLGLTPISDRYNTAWGSKSALGLGRTILRLVRDFGFEVKGNLR